MPNIPPAQKAPRHATNEFRVAGDVAYIILTDRKVDKVAEAIVDCENLERVLANSRWHLHPAGYAISTPNRFTGKRRILLHRFVLDAPAGRVVDHIFGQRLDCRTAALRLGSQSENLQNTISKPTGKSGQRNVHWQAQVKRWQVKIVVQGHTHCFGSYDDVAVAAVIALEARRSLHPFCRENVTAALSTLP